MIKLCGTSFDPGHEVNSFERRAENAGAVVSFVGKVRARAGEANVRSLYLEHFPGVTEHTIAEIESEARQRWAIENTLIFHRVGMLHPGEPIVLVCVSAAHRRDAFDAAEFLMDFLKTKAMFWKKEIRDDGESWIEPREADYKDAGRWRWDK
jgi:molybdopterin synthase catalytic subunit